MNVNDEIKLCNYKSFLDPAAAAIGGQCGCYPTRSSVGTDVEGPITIRGVGGLGYITNGFPTSVHVEQPNLARVL